LEGVRVEDGLTLRDFLHLVRRRKWIVLQTLVLVPLIVTVVSVSQPKLYQSSARVLLSYQNLANQLTGISGSSVQQQPDRIARTQAGLARTSAVASRVLEKVPGVGLTAGRFLSESNVSPNPNADVLIFSVTNQAPSLAQRLVNAYATAYTDYRHQLDVAPILKARANVAASLKKLPPGGAGNAQLRAQLIDRDQTLATMQALQTSNASVIQGAGGARQIQPRTKRNVMLAVVLGLILGLAFAYLWEALDTRVRNTDDIGKLLGGVPLLARVPSPSKRLAAENRLVMREDPDGFQAESFQMLRTNLDFVMLDSKIRTIMVTSAGEAEGKSTTISNLAIALARSGQRVALVDLDLRRPKVASFFSLPGPGVTQVALGSVPLEDALVRISLPQASGRKDHDGDRLNVGTRGLRSLPEFLEGSLHVLPAGAVPPDRGMFLDSQALNGILERMKHQVDVVLIDAPPALAVGDAITLSRKVDAILIVTRMNVVHRSMLVELARVLAMTPARILGFVATAAPKDVNYGYGYGYGYSSGGEETRRSKAKVGDAA
jgi:succinoglycan biosynthesis transport protein ExoP